MKKQKNISLARDLAISPGRTIMGYVWGRLSAWVNPLAIPNEVSRIREEGLNNFSEYLMHAAAAVGYVEGWYKTISRIVENPKDLTNYLPLMTNGAVLIGIGIKKVFDKSKLEEKLAR
jgi:hypothetical protein